MAVQFPNIVPTPLGNGPKPTEQGVDAVNNAIRCRFCAQSHSQMIEIGDENDTKTTQLRSLYEDLTKLKFSFNYPRYGCTGCLHKLREMGEFLDMLRTIDAFWCQQLLVSVEAKSIKEKASHANTNVNDDHVGSRADDCVDSSSDDNVDSSADDNVDRWADDNVDSSTDDPENYQVKEKLHSKSPSTEPPTSKCNRLPENPEFACAHCGYSFATKTSLIEHLQKIHTGCVAAIDARPMCVPCNKTFTLASTCRNHFSFFHLNEKSLQCQLCSKCFATAHQLRAHSIAEHNGRRYQCPQCPKQFWRKQHLQQHVNHHSVVKSFICDTCGKGLMTKGSLDRHIAAVHRKRKLPNNDTTKPHRCPVAQCGCSFSKLSTLQGHLKKKHPMNGIAEWQQYKESACFRCNLKFDNVAERETHVMQHIVLFPCGLCKNVYKTGEDLSNHMGKHSKKPRPYKCEICDATFVQRCHKEYHKQRVHACFDDTIACNICGFRCFSRLSLKMHMTKWHIGPKNKKVRRKKIKVEPLDVSWTVLD